MRFSSILTAAILATTAIAIGAASACFTEQVEFGDGLTIPVAWGDYDNDGDFDLAVGNFGGSNQLFRNDGGGVFTEVAPFGGNSTFAVAWADYDDDGDVDLAVGNGYNQQNLLLINNGDGTFAQTNEFGTSRTNAVAWGDYDLDGDLDLAIGNGLLNVAQQNHLYVNNGDGTFTEQEQFGIGQSATLVWGDCNHDGYLDLAVGNGGFGYVGRNYLYLNNGDGTFTEREEFGMGDTSTMMWGDADNDGDLDLAVGNWDGGQNYLYRNNGDGTFVAEPQFGARDPNTVSWGDFDNDGDLDLAIGNGDFQNADQNYLYINNGDGTYTEQAEFGLGSTDGVAWADIDGDGDLDLVSGNEHSPPQNYLYVNCQEEGQSLIVHLIGHHYDSGLGFSNRDAIGAKIAVFESGSLGDYRHLLGYREIHVNGGFSSQDAVDAHFGLGSIATADIRIYWPGSGGGRIVQDLMGVAADQRIVVEETGTPASIDEALVVPLSGASLRVAPNPTMGATRVTWSSIGEMPRRMSIHAADGRLVRDLIVSHGNDRETSSASWDGKTNEGEPTPPGLYFVRGTGSRAVGRILLLR